LRNLRRSCVRTSQRALLPKRTSASGLGATIVRPWYVLGPGHRWPYMLVPLYWVAERLPGMRDGARRLGLVTIDQMVGALVHAVENPAEGIAVVEVPDIRQHRR
jgi:nucleoside-diphosphate-sugar epimerase